MDGKEMFENAKRPNAMLDNYVIMSIPGIGPITGSVIWEKYAI
ncbi:MAG: hypothetical protein QXP36_13685 [Conexivisphaerales archaeon]